MTIKRIYLRDFRNYTEEIIDFAPAINVLVGDNAQGKTNLLEAISLLMTGRSFRSRHIAELIRFGANSFYIEALFEKDGVEQTLKFSFDGTLRTIIHNATALPSLSTLLGILNGVIFSPEDLSLIKGGPQARRHFLDLLLAGANPLYLHHLTRYLKALKQRNALLKQGRVETIDIWEEQMAHAAAFLTCRRAEAILELGKLTQSEALANEQFEISYRSSSLTAVGEDLDALRMYFLKQFDKHRKREFALGITLTGPHRDDLTFLLQEKEARHFGSEGQQRGCIATLKLAQWKWLQERIGGTPLLCIDDIGVSFDPKREEALYKRMQHLGQVFVTTARQSPSVPYHSIHVRDGKFSYCA